MKIMGGRERERERGTLFFCKRRWVCLKLQPQNVLKTRHTPLTQGLSPNLLLLLLLLLGLCACVFSVPLALFLLLSRVLCILILILYASFFGILSLAHPLSGFFLILQFYFILPIDTIEYFSSKVSDKSQDIL